MKFVTANFLLSLLIVLCFGRQVCAQSFSAQDSIHIIEECGKMLANPASADSINTELLKIKPEKLTPEWNDVYYYNYSKVLFQISRLEEAYEVANIGLAQLDTDSLNLKASKYHNIIGAVHSFQNEYPLAIQSYKRSVQIFDHHGKAVNAALVRNNIGNLFFSLSDYQSAYDNCKEAVKVLKENNDSTSLPGITAVLAVSAVRLGKLDEGTKLTAESKILSKKYNNPIGLIVSHLSEGEYEDQIGNFEASKAAYLISLDYAQKYGQKHYALLDKIGLLKAELKLKNYKAALNYGLEAISESDQLSNENTRYAILKNTSYAYAGLADFKNAFSQLDSAHNLYISTAGIENKATINEILIQYETEKKERELVESELKLASQRIKLNDRNNWIIALTAFAILMISLYWQYRKKKLQELNLIKKNAEKNALLAAIEGEEKERERLANELHDGIASGLTGVRLKLEQSASELSDTSIIEHLKNLQEDTRRISHNLMPLSLYDTSFEKALMNYGKENTSDQTSITVYQLNKKDLQLTPAVKNSLYRICQELIQNVLKHANSLTCTVQINQTEKTIDITIEDEGVGFVYDKALASQGLKSIKKRLEGMGGELVVESKLNEGTLVFVSLKKQA